MSQAYAVASNSREREHTMTRWNRHTDTCEGRTRSGKACQGCGSDATSRAQRRLYALRVLASMTGEPVSDTMTCPLTGKPFTTESGEVDRVDSHLGYTPGNIILVSSAGNQSRSQVQSVGSDIPGIARYAKDVRNASESVDIPELSEAARWHGARGTVGADLVMRGPYGI